jgi:hypothetical protein
MRRLAARVQRLGAAARERHGALAESVDGHWILQLCTETKAVPASTVRQQLQAQLEKIEAETGRKPRGKRAKELKEDIVHALLPRAFPKRAFTPVWVDVRSRLVVIGAASVKKADAVVTRWSKRWAAASCCVRCRRRCRPPPRCPTGSPRARRRPAFTIDPRLRIKQPTARSPRALRRHTLEIRGDRHAHWTGEGPHAACANLERPSLIRAHRVAVLKKLSAHRRERRRDQARGQRLRRRCGDCNRRAGADDRGRWWSAGCELDRSAPRYRRSLPRARGKDELL